MFKKQSLEFGGETNINPRLEIRPIASDKLIHMVLKSKEKILRKNKDFVEKTIRTQAEKAGVIIYDLSIQSDHAHHSLRVHSRRAYLKFIRATTGLLARKFGRGIWKYRPYTRVSEWGKAHKALKEYIKINELEALGLIPYQPRKK